ncbi:hypothetical protein L3C95_34655 [Chitinophaga filiformis]|uniref:hypothetical protein n=1 Tax=Chitinophaga filiformis TaxID=104663 RepID=UPI001F4403EA|nr:hypothetical protein [Chitinophaga filiformis]MCF6408081.1 hypothetical protein [Chitinophaga filiformis]
MKVNFILLITISFLTACQPFEGTRSFNGFNFYRIEPIATIDSSLKVDVTYSQGNIVKVDFKDSLKRLLSDTIIYRKDGIFLFQNHPEDDHLSSDSTLRILGKISDTVRTFVFGKYHEQFRLFFVETPLNDSVINVEFVHRSNIVCDNINEKVIAKLASFRQHVRFYALALEITFRYDKKCLYYTIVENYGDWKAKNFPDTLKHVYGSIYLDKYRIEMEELEPVFKLHLTCEEILEKKLRDSLKTREP